MRVDCPTGKETFYDAVNAWPRGLLPAPQAHPVYPWAYLSGVQLDYSRPGKPTENALSKSFNGQLRDEALKQPWFVSRDEARAVTEAWGRITIASIGRVLWETGRWPRVANNSVSSKLGAATGAPEYQSQHA